MVGTSKPLSVRRGVQIEAFSNFWMVLEAGISIGAGLAAHSLALTSFGADSVIELVTGTLLLWRLTLESRGGSATEVERAEVLSSWVVGIALLVLALYMVVAAVGRLMAHQGARTSGWGLGIAVASGVMMPYLSRAKKRIGRAIGSAALRSDGSCSMVCAYMSWILIAGITLTAVFGWWWIDSTATLALVYYVAKEGWEALEEARGHQEGDAA